MPLGRTDQLIGFPFAKIGLRRRHQIQKQRFIGLKLIGAGEFLAGQRGEIKRDLLAGQRRIQLPDRELIRLRILLLRKPAAVPGVGFQLRVFVILRIQNHRAQLKQGLFSLFPAFSTSV